MTEESSSALLTRIEQAAAAVTAASELVYAARVERDRGIVSGVGELALAKLQRALEDSEHKVATAEERRKVLDRALDQALKREAAENDARKVRAADDLLRQRCVEFTELEVTLEAVAAAATRIADLSLKAIETLPRRPHWTPPMFNGASLMAAIGLRLFALSEGKLVPAKLQATLYEAKKLPVLSARAVSEHSDVLGQYSAVPAKQPRAKTK